MHHMEKQINILAVSGSLRLTSINTTILKELAALAPAHVGFSFYEALDALPHFNPDIDNEPVASVTQWRQAVAHADGVVFCTPEYAFGIPGAFKNALDWLVSSGELNEKPVATISASPLPSGADKAHAALLHTMKALGTTIPSNGSVTIPAVKVKFSEEGQLQHDATKHELQHLLNSLITAIHEKQAAQIL